jgi:hypothetical protein
MSFTFRHIKPTTLLFLLLLGCIDPYKPKVIEEDISALVVDGFVNASEKTVSVDLSRTLPLLADYNYEPVTNATVVLEGEDGSSFLLYNNGAGKYSLSDLDLNESVKYRLYIENIANQYRSEYIKLKSSPLLDEITWEVTPETDGIQIYVDAHDPTNQTRYYQWVFTETWEYASGFVSLYILDNGELRIRNEDEFLNLCWKTEVSKKILINQTTGLTNDVVYKFPVQFIPKESQKISKGYSVLVQQRALDETAYNYLQQLQKTTEVGGGLFDPMPTQLTGNFHNLGDPSEPVIGYFRGGSVQEKRLFISRKDLAPKLSAYPSFACSPEDIFTVSTIASLQAIYPNFQVLYTLGSGIFVAPISCMDCRVSGGGVTTKPDFWP